MDGLFDNLSDIDSAEVDFDSDLDGFLGDFDDSSSEDFYSENGDEEDPLGPGSDAPESPASSPTPSPASSSISLPIHYPKPIRPPISLTSTILTLQAFEALTSTESPASTQPKGRKQNSIGARISALALFDSGATYEVILKQTGVWIRML
jgi:hypothetical protein